jgi:hypothetical protein
MKLIKITFILIILNSCQQTTGTRVNHVIIKNFKVPPVSVHDDISPRYKAVLENGDTIPSSQNSKPGDTVSFIYYKKQQ